MSARCSWASRTRARGSRARSRSASTSPSSPRATRQIALSERLGATAMRGSATMIPASTNAYDVAVAMHYLHEIDPGFHAQVVGELARVAKRVAIVEPSPPADPLGKRIAALYARAKRENGQFEGYQPIEYWRKLLAIVEGRRLPKPRHVHARAAQGSGRRDGVADPRRDGDRGDAQGIPRRAARARGASRRAAAAALAHRAGRHRRGRADPAGQRRRVPAQRHSRRRRRPPPQAPAALAPAPPPPAPADPHSPTAPQAPALGFGFSAGRAAAAASRRTAPRRPRRRAARRSRRRGPSAAGRRPRSARRSRCRKTRPTTRRSARRREPRTGFGWAWEPPEDEPTAPS